MLTPKGLKVNGMTISLDDARSEICFVSHAHSDHTAAFSRKRSIIASEETFLIMGKEPKSFPVSAITFHKAGHMLGAVQLSAETEQGKFVYTGDFALHDSYTAGAAKILQCDTLMIDTTYCQPHLRMPPRGQAVDKIKEFTRKNDRSIIVFGAYVKGKSQELVKILNKECSIAPVVNEKAAKICAAYEKCGVKLDYISAGTDEAEEQMRSPFVAIMPPNQVNFSFGSKLSEAFSMDVKTAVATGWAAVTKFPVDKAFALSDHADFKDTMRYIYGSEAKKIICANSNKNAAADYLKNIGIDAIARNGTKKARQATLAKC